MLHGRLLRYLDEVARTGSIRRAAANLNVASSAVNRQILALEAELGVPVFDRLPRRLRLTAAGEVLIQHVRRTLREHERVKARILHLSDPRYASAAIGTVSGLAGDLLALALDTIRAEKPHARFSVTVGSVDHLMNAIIAGDVDLAFAFDLPPSNKVEVVASVDSAFGVVVLPDHPFAGRPAVRLGDLSGEMLALPVANTPIRDAFDAAAARAGLVLEPHIESDSFEFLKTMARRGRGIAVLNRLDISTSRETGDVRFIPIAELAGQTQTLAVAVRAKASLPPLPSLVVETLRQLIHTRHDGQTPP